MNKVIEKFKKGSGIHIKEKNKGSFTRWCGGNVTSECIQRGKNSSNPKIRRKATFADNVRKWKHQQGGVMKAQEGSKFGQFLNSQGGQALIGGLTNLATTAIQNKNIKAQAQQQKAQNEMDWATLKKQILKQNQQEQDQYYKQWIQNYQSGLTKDNPSQIVAKHLGYENLNKQLAEGKELLKNTNNQIDAQTNSQISDNWIGTIGNVLQQGMGVVGNYLGQNTPSTSQINSQINDFSSGYNQFTKNSVLYNPDKFWNLK